MSAANRSAGREVHIYDANDPATVLGRLILTNGVTNANFYSMCSRRIGLCDGVLGHAVLLGAALHGDPPPEMSGDVEQTQQKNRASGGGRELLTADNGDVDGASGRVERGSF